MSARDDLLKLHDWDELVFGGFFCLHCTPDDEDSLDDPIAWPCAPLRAAGVTDEEAIELIHAFRVAVRDEARAQLENDKAEGQRRADDWNANHPVGTRVMAYPGVRPEDPAALEYARMSAAGRSGIGYDPCERLDTVTRTPAWILGHGEPVVSVEGYAGGIVLRHIDVIEEAS